MKTPANSFPPAGSMTVEEVEKEMIINSMEKFGNNLTKVAKSLGLSRGTLYRRLDKYNIHYDKNTR